MCIEVKAIQLLREFDDHTLNDEISYFLKSSLIVFLNQKVLDKDLDLSIIEVITLYRLNVSKYSLSKLECEIKKRYYEEYGIQPIVRSPLEPYDVYPKKFHNKIVQMIQEC